LKIAAPGLPDFYQGTEVWNFSLADPDNRRLVDYDLLQTLLGGCAQPSPRTRLHSSTGWLLSGGRRSQTLFNPLRPAFPPEHRTLFAKGATCPCAPPERRTSM